MIFIDFEVFEKDWLCVCIDPDKDVTKAIVNNADKLRDFYKKNKSEIWVGFNIRHYDQYIFKAILLGMNPKEVNDFIIVEGQDGYRYSDEFRNIPLFFYDVMSANDRGLKYFEGAMGNSIKESDVSFNLKRRLTESEIAETIEYCTHDVENTISVFIERIADFEAHIGLLKMFNLPLSDVSKTKVQLSAKILGAKRTRFDDEFNISFPDTLRIKKYTQVIDWYKNPENRDYSSSLNIDVAGVPHSFGWGGVHGAIDNYDGTGHYINMDVASLYPSLMIRYNLISRACDGKKFKEIVDLRLKYKKEKNPLQAPLKIVINGTYGASKDRFNPLYDPLQANNVCIYGQLLLLDLIEHLEAIGSQIIQSNTDGVLIRMPDGYKGGINAFYNKVDDTAWEWEKRTGLTLEFEEFEKVFQGDVNNYVIVGADGHWKSKGAYLKKLDNLDYDLAVVNSAILKNLLENVPIRETIYSNNTLRDFQMVKKISSKYKAMYQGGRELKERCVRCFASKYRSDLPLTKRHVNGRLSKLEGTPTHCRLVNGDIHDLEVPDWLDRNWYVKEAEKRIAKFKNDDSNTLF